MSEIGENFVREIGELVRMADAPEPFPVRMVGKVISVAPWVLEDVPMIAAVKADVERELGEFFQFTTTAVEWSEPEPLWADGEGEEFRLLPATMVADPLNTPSSVYQLRAYQRGVLKEETP